MEGYSLDLVHEGEIDQISSISRSEPSLSFRPTNLLKKSSMLGNLVGFRNSNNKLVGWIEISIVTSSLYTISTLYVFPRDRGQRLGEKLIRASIKKIGQKSIFTATSNASIIKLLDKLGFEQIKLTDLAVSSLVSLIIRRYYHPISWLKLFFSSGRGIKYYLRT